MTKIKKTKPSQIAIIAIVGVFVVSVAFASVGFSFNRVESLVAEKIFGKISGEINVDAIKDEPTFGAVTSYDFVSPWLRHNGYQTFMMNGSYIDETTTLVSFWNPFSTITSTNDLTWNLTLPTATSAIDLVALEFTGAATSGANIFCGMSDSPSDLPDKIFFVYNYTTNSVPYIENNIYTGFEDLGHGSYGIKGEIETSLYNATSTGSSTKIMFSYNYPYFVCKATGTPIGVDTWQAAATNPGYDAWRLSGRTLEGKFKVRVSRSTN